MSLIGLEAMRRYLGEKEKFYLSDDYVNEEGKKVEGDYIELVSLKGDSSPEVLTFIIRMESVQNAKNDEARIEALRSVQKIADRLLFKLVKESIPGASDEDVAAFVDKYYTTLLAKMMEMNIPKNSTKLKEATKKDIAKISMA